MLQKENLIGKRYGKLVLLKEVDSFSSDSNGYKQRAVRCRCDCGGEKICKLYLLRSGKTTSCGCMKRKPKKHGMTKTPEFMTWSRLRSKCYNENHSDYYLYGGRGIKVCDRWLDKKRGFQNFIEDMGRRPSDEHSIERLEVDGDYGPSNCKWGTSIEQARNTRKNRLAIEIDGITRSIYEWAEVFGIKIKLVRNRIRRNGWTPEQAVSTPIVKDRKYFKKS